MEKLELLYKRHSVRSFTKEPIPVELVNKLKAEVTYINTHEAGLKFQLIFNDNNPFKGFFKSYGTFVNPQNFLAAVVDTGVSDYMEKAGYFAEQFVIKAVEIGLGTCFVGGTYDPKSVNVVLRAGEKVLFVILFGYGVEKLRMKEKLLLKLVKRKIMVPEDFFEPESEYKAALKEFPELEKGMKGLACAPSSLNKRPARVFVRRENEPVVCAKVDESNPKNLIDLGIAKFNFNFATGTLCQWGNGAPVM